MSDTPLDIWLIGIGTGSPAHVTAEGMQALRDVSVVLVPEKGAGKDDLAALRRDILKASGTKAQVVAFDYPERDPALPYIERVARWHDEIARRWQSALTEADRPGPVGLLVWGDPSLYDSTLRIARRLSPAPRLRVVPGITAIQALTAAHVLTLNTLNGPVTITTGRRLRDHGWPQDAETLVVMLDGDCSFQMLPPDTSIWWGAFLGMPEQILAHGRIGDVAQQIIQMRAQARAQHGWIMDTYLLRRQITEP
ncbi:precorrin-6A synthase (deacetylating) [Pseudosulfitobacter pseudonitzschiae]|uniref:precorrin-6A synthase (deacetylating) n=1 Tax=Pseudosulfitobacter pseudonitzschiae TaxID=1402135 RepID=UPI001AFB6441|nr:precorrin-6A synthase (deacetylating) [Pseudosulfitobacter pseudonitzschiae]MBM1816694.1 precorrin-6A synthase (deacetylating) [Pseudosulfitobacter pseudonitzschiae]MBM1833504.1 precorrin-6A synthase (deacetylating) [Pseudosulfitobacter pseudonitzschiae]MBM1838371.1 precorrin-6A synthase (deacetylating) [Pseudosulfitobacter pseudonitzschiae]MBM1843421.1 precorrin-6A synthase (deacetylating) [Pseudosulfitobacter pseudonitzschiae]MBM1848287.1 precorrin-6A synthase (deacetylating) [Pseudosulfi